MLLSRFELVLQQYLHSVCSSSALILEFYGGNDGKTILFRLSFYVLRSHVTKKDLNIEDLMEDKSQNIAVYQTINCQQISSPRTEKIN